MENQLNTGTLDALKPGQTLLYGARLTNTTKIQLEFAEKISDVTPNVLQMFNASDDRFKRGARRAWLTAEPQDAARLLGIDEVLKRENFKEVTLAGGKKLQFLELNVLNPTMNGQRLRVQITETTTPPDAYAMENIETTAKRKGKEGDFITHNGYHIFTVSEVVMGEPKHTMLEADAVSTNNTPIPAAGASLIYDEDTGEIFN